MNYTLHQLHVFVKVAQTLSITRTAEALHLTQPAVSIQLKNFQDQFDIPLTQLIGRRLHLTDFGREIAQAAQNVLNGASAINDKTLAYKGLLYGKLTLSVVSTGKYVMPYFLSGFMGQHTGIELSVDVTNRQKVVESLSRNEVDFSLVSILPQQLPVQHLALMPNKLYLVGPRPVGNDGEEVGPALLETLPLIYREAGSGTRYMMEKFIADHGLTVSKRLELTSNEAVKQALLAGLGYSIMPLIGLKSELINRELQIIPVRGLPLQTTWMLIWHKDKQHSPVAQAYLTYLREHEQTIIRDCFGWCER
jgi:LysR family transcriptional regulator, low CO2-responsive transcriptional regulator